MTSIKSVSIENFKSIEKVGFDCKRINVFIGKPNVGKSNILEALSLYALSKDNFENIRKAVRFENSIDEIYNNRNPLNPIKIELGLYSRVKKRLMMSQLGGNAETYQVAIGDASNKFVFSDAARKSSVDENIKTIYEYLNKRLETKLEGMPASKRRTVSKGFYTSFDFFGLEKSGHKFRTSARIDHFELPILPYRYNAKSELDNGFPHHLIPPHGKNLFGVMVANDDLRDLVKPFFRDFDVKLTYDITSRRYELLRLRKDEFVRFPLGLIADTLKRMLFHLAAIKSASSSIILFEEPESHSYPEYIRFLSEQIVADESNQYFIVTHSPYFLNALLEYPQSNDVSINLCYTDNGVTRVYTMTEKDINRLLETGMDIFFNMDAFINHDSTA